MIYEIWITEDCFVEKLVTCRTKKDAENWIEKYKKYYNREDEKLYIEEKQ